MKKNNILKKLNKELKDNIDYSFIVLDLRKYPHTKGMFLAYHPEEA